MTIDLSLTIEDMLAEIGWSEESSVEIEFGDVGRLKETETGYFKKVYPTEICGQYEIGAEIGDFLNEKYGLRLFIRNGMKPHYRAISNAIKRGNKEDPSKTVEIECYFTSKGFVGVVRDEGEGFDVQHTVDNIRWGHGLNMMKYDGILVSSYNKKGNECYMMCSLPRITPPHQEEVIDGVLIQSPIGISPFIE